MSFVLMSRVTGVILTEVGGESPNLASYWQLEVCEFVFFFCKFVPFIIT